MLVRIPNDYIRQKILEKRIWYIGDYMFHDEQWASHHSAATPALVSIPIWAHLRGVPLDLRSLEGLSWVAGLIGEPKETNEFTINLTSLHLAHVKVEVDLTKPLPDVIELGRTDGQVNLVDVDYPWIPPTCSHCKELGHIDKNCLRFPPLGFGRNRTKYPPNPAKYTSASHITNNHKPSPQNGPTQPLGPTINLASDYTETSQPPNTTDGIGLEDSTAVVDVIPSTTKDNTQTSECVIEPQLSPIPLSPTHFNHCPFNHISLSLSYITNTFSPPNSPIDPTVNPPDPFIVGLPASITSSGHPYPHNPLYEQKPHTTPKKFKHILPLPPLSHIPYPNHPSKTIFLPSISTSTTPSIPLFGPKTLTPSPNSVTQTHPSTSSNPSTILTPIDAVSLESETSKEIVVDALSALR